MTDDGAVHDQLFFFGPFNGGCPSSDFNFKLFFILGQLMRHGVGVPNPITGDFIEACRCRSRIEGERYEL